jgi:hypothetical protein
VKIRGNLENISRRPLFSAAGVDCSVTRRAWLSGPFFLAFGMLLAFFQQPRMPSTVILPNGAIYGLVLFLSNMLHSAGHVIAGRVLGAPHGSVIITAAFHINYHRCEPGICSKWTHIGRSSGGPLANLLLGCVALGLSSAFEWVWLDIAAKANLIIGIWLLLPIPSLDGWVIWGELIGFRRRLPGKDG